MFSRDDPSYYLYGNGFDTSVLQIGHLVFGPYERPMSSKHFNNVKLSGSDIEKWTDSYPISGTYKTHEGRKPSLLLNIASVLSLDVATPKTFDITVAAKAGKRVEIKDPQTFFKEKVATDPSTLNQLALWLTAAKSDRMKRLFRKPKIWFLTGFFQFEDVDVTVSDSNNPSFSAGLSADTLIATGVPSAKVNATFYKEESSASTVHIDRPLIWAARYHLLDVEYPPSPPTEPSDEEISTNLTLDLYPDITSKGQYRTGGEISRAKVSLLTTSSKEEGSDSEDKGYLEYWTALYGTISDFEMLLNNDNDED